MIDIGSGAGFPGMVLAIAGARQMSLVESDSRKALFLREVARLCDTGVTIHNSRIEDLVPEQANIIVSRACSNIDTLLYYSFPHVSHETICLFPKGKNYSKDIQDAKIRWKFSHRVIPSVTDSEGVILRLTDIEKRGA
jgi:16S rRNA (guanine527-N7)-methyltransferase